MGTKQKGPSSGGKSVGWSGSASVLEGCRMPAQAASVACTDPFTRVSCKAAPVWWTDSTGCWGGGAGRAGQGRRARHAQGKPST